VINAFEKYGAHSATKRLTIYEYHCVFNSRHLLPRSNYIKCYNVKHVEDTVLRHQSLTQHNHLFPKYTFNNESFPNVISHFQLRKNTLHLKKSSEIRIVSHNARRNSLHVIQFVSAKRFHTIIK
jgi:hypothetical protein